MDMDGSILAAALAGVTAVITSSVGYGKSMQRVNRLSESFDKLAEDYRLHERDYLDRMARLETIAENQNVFHQKMDEKMDRLLERDR